MRGCAIWAVVIVRPRRRPPSSRRRERTRQQRSDRAAPASGRRRLRDGGGWEGQIEDIRDQLRLTTTPRAETTAPVATRSRRRSRSARPSTGRSRRPIRRSTGLAAPGTPTRQRRAGSADPPDWAQRPSQSAGREGRAEAEADVAGGGVQALVAPVRPSRGLRSTDAPRSRRLGRSIRRSQARSREAATAVT